MRATPSALLLAAPLFAALLAGCLAGDGGPAPPAGIGEPIVLDHDHTDHRLHTASHGVAQVAWSPLDVTLGENGFANFVLWSGEGERLAFVAVDGDTRGGFTIADVSDPADIRVLGSYRAPGSGFQEVRVTPDGRYALLNVQEVPDPFAVAGEGAGACSVCIHVVDVQDRAAPRLVSVLPVEAVGTHNLHIEAYPDGLHLFAVGQPAGGVGGLPAEPGNHVWVYRIEVLPTGAVLVPVSSLQRDLSGDTGRSFPHDVMVQDHPITGQKIAYVSHWDGGHVLFDVTDPLAPRELAVLADPAPSDALAVHWLWQEEWVRPDGRVIAWSAPEIGVLESGTGVVRALDVTDPARPVQVGTWTLPGDLAIEGRYILSPHTVTVDPATGLSAVAHYHAGVWVLDATNPAAPTAVAFHLPHGDPADPHPGPVWWKKPNFSPDGYGPNVYQARWDPRDDGTLLWVTDRGTGLYALRVTVDAPGPVATG